MRPQSVALNVKPFLGMATRTLTFLVLGLTSLTPASALSKIYAYTHMTSSPDGESVITHLVFSNRMQLSSHVTKVRFTPVPFENVYPDGADIAYTGTIYPFDDKEIWFNRSRTIAAVNLKPVVDICELYLVLSTKGGLLVIPDCDSRIGAVCRSHDKHYELGWLRVDAIKGRVITVESEKSTISGKITHIRLYVSHDGQFRLLRYWRTRPTE